MFTNLPPGTRAVALPDNSYTKAYTFLDVFGRPDSQSVCECERVQSSSLAQSLHLINSADMKSKLAVADGRAAKLAVLDVPVEEKVTDVYLAAFARNPSTEELQTAVDYLNEPRTDVSGQPIDPATAARQNYQDLIWAVINSKEFLFNH